MSLGRASASSLRRPWPRRCCSRRSSSTSSSRTSCAGQVDRNLRDQVEQVSRVDRLPVRLDGDRTERSTCSRCRLGRSRSPFQLVDPNGGLYRLPQAVRPDAAAALPGVDQAREVATGERDDFYFEAHFNGQHVRLLADGASRRLRDRGRDAADERRPRALQDPALAAARRARRDRDRVRRGLPRRARGAQAGARPERHGRARSRDPRPLAAHRGERQRRAQPPRDHLQRDARSRSTRRSSGSASSSRTPRTSCARRSRACARTSRCSRSQGGDLPPEEREQLLEDVVAQLSEMTDLIAELTELARGEEQQTALEEVRLDLAHRGRDPAHGAEPPRRADRGRPRADDGRRHAGEPRARDREPARQRGEVEPARRAASRSRLDGGELTRARPRAGHRRGRPAARLRALLPRDLGAEHAGLGARPRDRAAGGRDARRHGRRRGGSAAAAR